MKTFAYLVESNNKYWIKTASETKEKAIEAWKKHPKFSPDFKVVQGVVSFEETKEST